MDFSFLIPYSMTLSSNVNIIEPFVVEQILYSSPSLLKMLRYPTYSLDLYEGKEKGSCIVLNCLMLVISSDVAVTAFSVISCQTAAIATGNKMMRAELWEMKDG